MITAEYLAEQKKEAETERSRLLVTLHQLDGAIGILNIMIREAEKPEKVDEPPPEE